MRVLMNYKKQLKSRPTQTNRVLDKDKKECRLHIMLLATKTGKMRQLTSKMIIPKKGSKRKKVGCKNLHNKTQN